MSAGRTVVIRLCLRQLGGKGGFGALLRGGPQGVHKKKQNNFDACRDLSGRRVRHGRTEKELQEWFEKKAEREAKRKAEKLSRKEKAKGELCFSIHPLVSYN